jgi:cleavage and polyadenylation specificity factor subunit 1
MQECVYLAYTWNLFTDGILHPQLTDKNLNDSGQQSATAITRFHFLREHRLHGMVTGLEGVRILSSIGDSLDRLLISFRDAKVR